MPRTSLRYERPEFEAKVGELLSSLQILPKNTSLYILACIHRSVLNEAALGYTESNERLEYLGDAVLELVITEALFHEFTDKPEGQLTDIRSALVRGRNLAEIAARLHFSDAIQLSRGEAIAAWHENPYILANTLEAMLGALYLDQGFEITKQFILRHIYATLPHILEKGLYVDPKSYLQEFTQWVWGTTPNYRVTDETGEDHNKVYTVTVYLEDMPLGVGKGSSKKKAEQDAAENAITRRGEWETKVKLPKKVI